MESYYLKFGNKMSRIGNQPIKIPENVELKIEGQKVLIKGPNGELSFELPDKIKVEFQQEERILKVKRESDQRKVKALHGLWRSLLNNAVQGVVKPWEKKLEVVGTGYNVKLEGDKLVFKVGYSHPVVFQKPEGIEFQVEKGRIITVKGVDRQKVGEVAYKIRSIKKPDAYKGKGIRYLGEQIKLKPGKKAKVG